MKKLNFTILVDGILEARESDRVYSIFQMEGRCDATINGKHLISGDLYECLDACNKHNYEIVHKRNLDISQELDGCFFEKVDELFFKDHDGEVAACVARKFKSLSEVRTFVQKQSELAVVYVYRLTECKISGTVEYHLMCAIREKENQ